MQLGCHVGKSTRILTELAPQGKIISLDKSPESANAMPALMDQCPYLTFIKGDVRLHQTLEDVSKR